MIYTNVDMNIGNETSTVNSKVVLYRGDKNVEIRLTMKGNRFVVSQNMYAQLIIVRPLAASVFSEISKIENNTVILTINEQMIDEFKETGEYSFQIRLYDDNQVARVTLPPVQNGIIIKNPIAVENESIVELALVDSAVVYADLSEEITDIFDEEKTYMMTDWQPGDVITAARLNKIEEGIYYVSKNGGGGSGSGATAPYISTMLPETVLINTGENLYLDLDFNSPNIGKGTLKVFVNDVESLNIKIQQGESTSVINYTAFVKGTNRISAYVVDRVGVISNTLTFYVRYGGLELTTTFDADSAYDVGSNIRYYFVPSALDTSLPLTFYIEVDGVQESMSCTSDVRSAYMFSTSLTAGRHSCKVWISDGTNSSTPQTFNLILLDANNIVISTNTGNLTIEEGYQIILDYKVFKKGDSVFNTKTYIDSNLISTGTCNLETQYYRNSTLLEGIHTVKIEVTDITNTVTDYITWTITVTPSQYELVSHSTSGAIFLGTAQNRNNTDANRETWQGVDQDGVPIDAILDNFTFNNENGWINDALVISGDSTVEIPISPLSDNAKYGLTVDIEFMTKSIGIEDAEVFSIWDKEKDIGIKITLEELIIKSTSNEKRLYFSEGENLSVIFVIDRDEKTAKILINGVVCGGFALGDYVASGVPYLEDFSTNAPVILGGKNKNGYCEIKNLRIYSIALGTSECLNNFISNIKNKSEQKELVNFQKGDTLPTLTVTGDFSGLGKDDKKPCDMVFQPTDPTIQGEAFILEGKYSQLQYQGTSSMQYPIKNYRLNPRDANGKVKINPFKTGKAENRFTLKADSASSGHWQNTGLAKWVNDKLYDYDVNDPKSMNPMKWWSLQNGGKLEDTRETINGFPCRLILVNDGESILNEGQNEPTPGNTKDMGIFNFNNDKDNTKTLGLDTDIFPNCISFEVTANSDTSAGAFMSYKDDGDAEGELDYFKQSFELRYPDEDDVGSDYGFLDINGDSSMGLKRVIDFVDNSTDEEFISKFEEYFNKQYTFRYYLLVVALGMVDNLGKNMMLDSWDCKIWYPRFYDMDTICGFNNSGIITFETDIEMEQGYWNTSSSRLWTRIRDLFHPELVELYKSMRSKGLSYESLMTYFYNEQIAKIPQAYYNKDYDVKYAPFADQYMGMANGNGYEHLKRWLKRRIQFTDSLFDYSPSYSDSITIRANTDQLMTIEIETYVPVYQHMSWYNGQMDKKKIDGKTAVTFSGKAQAVTDQEVIIYGGSNIKRIRGISSMNPDSMLIGNATKLVELECNNAPLLTDINSNKANLSPNKYLTKVDISNCPQLGGTLRLNNSALLQEVNAHGTAITGMLLPTSIKNLQSLKVPKGVTELALYDAKTLTNLDLEEGYLLETLTLSNCNKLKSFDLSKVKNISLDNSYNAEELRLTINQSVDLKNMSSLKRLIYLPNNEIEEFDLSVLRNSGDYVITTFNCPNLKDFITTAPQRNSYGESDSNIYPNKLFMANKLDLGGTQFENVKFLCTTDIFDLVLPNTLKNFYCDSAFDIDTNIITDASYEVIHNDLIQPYTEEYNENVYKYEENIETYIAEDERWIGKYFILNGELKEGRDGWVAYCGSTDYIKTKAGCSNSIELTSSVGSSIGIIFFNENKELLSYVNQYGNKLTSVNAKTPLGAEYVMFWYENGRYQLGQPVIVSFDTPQTPNIVPTSANGSLLFNINTTPKTSSPYVWDLQGMKLNDFYTYGVNNRVNCEGIEYKVKTKLINKWSYGSHLGGQKTNWRCLPPISFDESINSIRITSDNIICHTIQTGQDGSGVGQSTWSTDLPITFTGNYATYRTIGITLLEKDISWIKITCDNGKVYTININELEQVEISTETECLNLKTNIDDVTDIVLIDLQSITMPKRLADYKVQIKNADITPTNYNAMLYPKLVDTTLPITGKVDYSKYKGTSLAWAFAFSTSDVTFNPLDSRSQGQITNDYNKLYSTDYVDIVDVWAYKDDDFSNRSTNENITKAYIELTQDNYKSRIDEVLQWYPNCTDIYLFEDGSVTNLSYMLGNENSNSGNPNARTKVKTIRFMDGYFNNTTSGYSMCNGNGILEEVYNIPNNITEMGRAFMRNVKLKYISNFPNSMRSAFGLVNSCNIITEIPEIPNTVTNLESAFANCYKLNQQFDLSNYVNMSTSKLNNAWQNCSSLTYTPILPSNYTGSLDSAFIGTKITEAPVLPNGVTTLNSTFRDCKELTTVGNIPNSCTGYAYAFYNCPKLVSIPETGWKGSMYYTFSLCSSLNQKIVIESATTLEGTFRSMTSLTITPNIPNNVTSINNIFNNCQKITSVTIPLTNITSYNDALSGCTSLTNINWEGQRTTDFNLITLGAPSYNKASIINLVKENLSTVENAILTLSDSCSDYLSVFEVFSLTEKGWKVIGASSSDGNFNIIKKDEDTTVFTTDDTVTMALIEITQDNYKSRIYDVLQWYPNCIEICLFEDGSVTDLSGMFYNCNNSKIASQIIKISTLSKHLKNVTDMSYMFAECSKLTTLDVSNFDTGNVKNMSYMFNNCNALTTLDVSNFDTGNVKNMTCMFNSCRALTTLDVSGFNTSNVTDMSYMFNNCNALTTLDVSGFNTSNVTDMSYMFNNCNALTTLDVSNFETGNVTNMCYMFRGCSGLTTLDVSGFITSNVTDMRYIFNECSKLTTLDVSNFDTGNVKNMGYMFYNCNALTTLDVSNFDTGNVKNMGYMFYNCNALTTLDVSGFNTSNVTDMSYMFNNCNALTTLDVSNFETGNVKNMSYMFRGCSGLTTLDVSGFNTSNVTNMFCMFSSSKTLTTLDLSNFDTSNVTDMRSMFYDCNDLTTLDVSNFNTSKITSMYYMFRGCSKLTSLDLSSFDTSKVTDMSYMFSECFELINLKFHFNFKANYVNILYDTNANLIIEWLGDYMDDISIPIIGKKDLSQTNIRNLFIALSDISQESTIDRKITLYTTQLDSLAEDDKVIAISKGWTLEAI